MPRFTRSIPRRMRPPGTRQRSDFDEGEPPPPDGPLGFGLVAQRGSACTSPIDCTPPRPLEKYFLYSSGKPGSDVGSPVCPAIRKFSTYAPPEPVALLK